MLTSVGIAMSFNIAAQDTTLLPPVSPVTLSAPDTLPVQEMSSAEKIAIEQARLERVVLRLKKTQAGRDLLKFADDTKIEISFKSPREVISKNKDGSMVEADAFVMIAGVSYANIINLDPRPRTDDELLLTVVHEIRHIWQAKAAKADGLHLNSKQEWLMDRFKEADAFSYQIHFAYEFKKETGDEITFRNTRACQVFMSQACLYDTYAEKRDAGMTAEQAYPYLIEAAFRHVKQLDYDSDFLGNKRDRWNDVAAKPEMGAAYESMVDEPSSDTDLVATLRRMVNVGLTPSAAPALSTWTNADFLSLEKTGGVDEKQLKSLEEINKLQDSAMIVYKMKRKP